MARVRARAGAKGVGEGKGKGKGSGGKGWAAPLVAAAALGGGAHAAPGVSQWSAPPGARLEATWRGAPLMPTSVLAASQLLGVQHAASRLCGMASGCGA